MKKNSSLQLDSIQQSFHDSELMSDTAEVLMQKGSIANKQGDGFTLCTVLFTVVLLFLGLASLKTHSAMQKTYVTLAVVILVLTLVRMVTIPFPF